MELHVSVICASMPSIRNLLRRYMPYVMGQSTSDTQLSTTRHGTEKSGKSVKDIITIRTMDSDEENFISLDDYNSANRTVPLDDSDYSGRVRTPPLNDYGHLEHSNNRTLPLPSDDAYTHATTETIVTAGNAAQGARKKRLGWF